VFAIGGTKEIATATPALVLELLGHIQSNVPTIPIRNATTKLSMEGKFKVGTILISDWKFLSTNQNTALITKAKSNEINNDLMDFKNNLKSPNVRNTAVAIIGSKRGDTNIEPIKTYILSILIAYEAIKLETIVNNNKS
jgi:hypothetical protein